MILLWVQHSVSDSDTHASGYDAPRLRGPHIPIPILIHACTIFITVHNPSHFVSHESYTNHASFLHSQLFCIAPWTRSLHQTHFSLMHCCAPRRHTEYHCAFIV